MNHKTGQQNTLPKGNFDIMNQALSMSFTKKRPPKTVPTRVGSLGLRYKLERVAQSYIYFQKYHGRCHFQAIMDICD
jgi:hypothetical protein